MPHPSRTISVHRDIAFARYTINAGEAIPEHEDVGDAQHVTICALGQVRVIGPNIDKILNAGDHHEFGDADAVHSVQGVAQTSVIYNILKSLI